MAETDPERTSVRSAREADLDAISRISVAAYERAGQLEPGSAYRAVLADADGRYRNATLLVAQRGEQVVGTVTICPGGSPYAEIGRENEVEFRFLAVDPDHWGAGVADCLIAACEDQARRIGAQALTICVRDNNTGAAAMYAARGFVRVPERDWSPLPGVDLMALTRVVPSDVPGPAVSRG
ncbi:MAG TPA: GNAT family N-acetyltransferase [Actinobacteria bacterium]|jgi:GNAT superfamily N-acetyltransferase|nr:GNAT family N-acetyltransferase [Actinomycetota bacterium]